MRPIQGVLFGSAVIALMVVGMAFGQKALSTSGTAKSGAAASGTATSESGDKAGAEVAASADAGATADADASLQAIRDRAKSASKKARAEVEKKLDMISRQIDAEARANGDVVIASRVAPEYGMTADDFTEEQIQFDAGMGELVIAHTLMASSKTPITAEEVFSLRQEGLGWGQIAHGLNLKLGDVASAVSTEGSVAAGRTMADGKPATIQSGARVTTNTSAGIGAGKAGVSTASNVGVAVKVGK